MPLILAIESDRRQAARISSLARERLNVELLVAESAEKALQTLAERTPDLILTPQLLSPKDEAALDERLRELDAAGSHVQTLMIPVLASSGRRGGNKGGGLLNRLRRAKDEGASEGGCDPAVFAAQIAEYLQRAADDRAAQAVIAEDARSIAEDDRAYQASVLEVPQAPPDRIEPALSEFHQEFAEPQTPDAPVATVVDDAVAAPMVEEPAFDELSQIFAAPDVEEAPMMAAEAPIAIEAQPAADMQESWPAGLEEFVEFDELTIVDAPSIAFGELTGVVERIEAEALEAATSVLDALELLAEPEIPIDFEPDPTPSDFDFEGDLWMPLPVAAHRRWPALQGPTVKASLTPAFDAPPDADVEFAPPPDPHDRASGKKRSRGKPFQDEWGFFDPVQCGFAALLAKLDEVTDKDEAPSEP